MLTALLALALAGAPQDSTHLVIVATADARGRAIGWDYAADAPAAGGLARVAAVVDSLRARYPGQVVLVDAGGALNGSVFGTYAGRVAPRDPHPVIDAMNLAGYDAGTPGLHDFDLGVPAMRRAFAGASFPYVSANLVAVAGDTSVYPGFTVVRRGGVRVAIAGFTSPGVTQWNGDKLRGQLRVAPIAEAGPRTLEAARRQADVVIALAGAGAEPLMPVLTAGPAPADLVVVGGADRKIGDSVAGGVRVVQPRPDATHVTVVHMWLERGERSWRPRRTEATVLALDAVAPATRVSARLANDQERARVWAQTVIGSAATEFSAADGRTGASALTNFINRVQRDRAGTDLSATPLYSLTAGLPRGRIRRADLVALSPFENTLRAVRISGAQLKTYLEHAARYYQVDPVGRITLNENVDGRDFDVVGGAAYELDLRAPAGNRVRNLAVRGRAVQRADSFTMALGSYRHNGIGGYTMLAGAPVVYDRGEYIRDLLADEIERRRTVDPAEYAEQGWRIVPAEAAAAVRALFDLPDSTAPLRRSRRDSVIGKVIAVGGLRGRFDVVPRLKAAMDSLVRQCQCAAIRLGTGDAAPGGTVAYTIAGGASAELLNRLDLTAAVFGERELNWSRDTLRRRIALSNYPWLAANVFDSATGGRAAWSEPYRVVKAGSLRIAVIGYVSSATGRIIGAERAAGLRFAEGLLPLDPILAEVRATQPDLTILVVHADSSEVEQLVGALPRGSIDLVIAGHRINTGAGRIGEVPVVWAGADTAALAGVDVVRTAAGGIDLRVWTAEIAPGLQVDVALAAFTARFLRQADSLASRPVATLKLPLDRRDRRLGQLVAEARRNALRADVGLVRDADLSSGIAAGPVSYNDALRVQPGGRALVAATVTGAQLIAVAEQLLRDGMPAVHLAGIQVRYDPKRPAGRRVRRIQLPNGQELRRDHSYRIAVDEDLLHSPGGFPALTAGALDRSDLLDVDALVFYLQRLSQPVEIAERPGFIPSEP